MNCNLRKIRAKVRFFRELSEKCVKKAVESIYFTWYNADSSSNPLCNKFRFYAINTLYCIKKYVFCVIGCVN